MEIMRLIIEMLSVSSVGFEETQPIIYQYWELRRRLTRIFTN